MVDTNEEDLPAAKRRKIRKGTQSCWECKRRKIRCTFCSPTESTCDGCRSRRVKCISQEFHNENIEEASTRSASQMARLDRVEALVDQLAKRAGPDEIPSLLPHDTDTQDVRTKATGCVNGDNARIIPASQNTTIPSTGLLLSGTPDQYIQANISGGHDELCNALLAAWPSQRDFDLIISVPVGISILFHGVVCLPYSSFLSKDIPSPREMLQLPPPGSHPVLIARKLLMLGSFLQGIPPGDIKDLGRLGANCRQLMSHMVWTARRLVTSNDDLVESLEGIECIMIESMYHNNAGDLRHAWLVNRRAMGIAQMMGLHLGKNTPKPKILEIDTKKRIDPEYMWLRLVLSDRYLSLMLGLPQGYPESPFATPEALERCTPIERFERLESVVGGLIIQRNKEDLHNLDVTQRIDKLLQDAAASMPAQWWLTPDITSIAGSDAAAFSETMRIMGHFTHYHLLAQLHLPYVLQSSTERKHDYSKITAVHASREILSRFVYVRGSSKIAAYCRGIDFLALYACTVLCLAHIIGTRTQDRMNDSVTVFRFLTHQRLGDRGLMESTLQIMDNMAQTDNDTIACKITSILQCLLTIEAAAANGDSYKAGFSLESDGNNQLDSDDTLTIDIPFYGKIKIEYDGVLRLDSTELADEFQISDSFGMEHLLDFSDDWTVQQ